MRTVKEFLDDHLENVVEDKNELWSFTSKLEVLLTPQEDYSPRKWLVRKASIGVILYDYLKDVLGGVKEKIEALEDQDYELTEAKDKIIELENKVDNLENDLASYKDKYDDLKFEKSQLEVDYMKLEKEYYRLSKKQGEA